MKITIIITIIVGVTGAFLCYLFLNTNPNSNSVIRQEVGIQEEQATTKVRALDISINLPSTYRVDRGFNSLTLSQDDKVISVGKIGTNFDNVENYILYHGNNLEDRLVNRERTLAGGHDAIVGYIDNRKYYFIYTDHRIYSFSTSSPELYDDLDQIAHSFKYLGD